MAARKALADFEVLDPPRDRFSYDSGAWGGIAVDLEEIRLTPQMYAPTPWGELSVQMPVRLYYGGFIDYLLNPIHQALRMPMSPLSPQTYPSMRRQGQPPHEITAPVFGVGDLVLGGAVTGPGESWGHLSLGDSSRYLGSGGFRLAVVGWDEETWGLPPSPLANSAPAPAWVCAAGPVFLGICPDG